MELYKVQLRNWDLIQYVQLKARHKNPEFRQARDERVNYFFRELVILNKQNPDNGTIQRSLLMANMKLYYPGAQD